MNEFIKRRKAINRRAFLYGAGTIAIGLPFLEGLPERSAWAANAQPIFTFFLCGACGVEPKRFWPGSTGALSGLLASGKAVDALADQAKNLLIVKGINFPLSGPSGCGHAQGLSQALTAKTPTGNGAQATATGPSVDFVISKAINPAGTDPMTLYAGNVRNGYIADRLSFDDSARVRASVDNPYKLYQKLTGLAAPAGSGGGGSAGGSGMGGGPAMPPANPQAEELIAKRKSVNDTIRAELNSLMQNPKLSAADKQRLQQHFDAIRDTEKTMTDMGTQMATVGCTLDGISTSAYQALSSWKYNATNVPNGGIENIVELHMGLVALAFACDHNRTGTLQWGDGTDHTVYQVPANETLGKWNFHFISHRTQSDGAVGSNSTAEAAHAEIDALRMATLAKSLKHFADRGLQDKAIVVWTNHVAEGNHQMRNVPFIVWGNGGGVLKQGQYVDAAGATNGQLYNTIITAATGNASPNFGSSGGKEIAAVKV
ncbi:MAG TPA: DUF1552 domain-containing protein [Polyangiaceae bacterium]|nr:DUF1552 domain-containing protein [Polyangiaceae bacterium]